MRIGDSIGVCSSQKNVQNETNGKFIRRRRHNDNGYGEPNKRGRDTVEDQSNGLMRVGTGHLNYI